MKDKYYDIKMALCYIVTGAFVLILMYGMLCC